MFIDETFLTFISDLGFNFTDDKVLNLLIEYSGISWVYLTFVIFLTSLFVNRLKIELLQTLSDIQIIFS